MTVRDLQKRGFALLSILFALGIFAAQSTVKAEESTKVAVVDVQRLLSESKAAQSIQAQLEEQREKFQKEFSKQERNLIEEQKGLIEERSDLSKEEFAEKRNDFEEKLSTTRRQVQENRRALEKAASKSILDLRQEITEVIAKIAEKNDYTLVITRQNVILAKKEMDITDIVMKNLNKQVKDIKLEISSQ